MLTLESIMKYKNFKIKEEEELKRCDLKRKLARNKRILRISYYVLYSVLITMLAAFLIGWGHCINSGCDFKGAYYLPKPLAYLNIIVWALLAVTTISFIIMINKRFGDKEFGAPKCKLIAFLSVFSISFFLRGTWDLVAYKFEPSKEVMAILIFLVYFFTEWLPIFVTYLTHYWAFKQHNLRRNSRGSETLPQIVESADDKLLTK